MRKLFGRFEARSLYLFLLLGLVQACVTTEEAPPPRRVVVPQLCPGGMVYVNAPDAGVELCVDRYELTENPRPAPWAIPLAYQNFFDCQQRCQAQGKRLLTHREWLTSCAGTTPAHCNVNRPHPIVRKMTGPEPWVYNNVSCKNENAAWGPRCMSDPTINQLPNSIGRNGEFPRCVSRYGVYNMVGNLGEWVQDQHMRGGVKLGRFNGGLYPQPKSRCEYTTIAHGPGYRDYSIGCRCGKDASQAAKQALQRAAAKRQPPSAAPTSRAPSPR